MMDMVGVLGGVGAGDHGGLLVLPPGHAGHRVGVVGVVGAMGVMGVLG